MDTKFIRIYQNEGKEKTIVINRNYTKEQLEKVLEGGPVKEDIDEVLSKGIYLPEGGSLKIVFSSHSWTHEHSGRGFKVLSFQNKDEITISPDCTLSVNCR